MKKYTLSALAGALIASSAAYANTVAITNATIHTATEQGTLENASVVIENGVITAVNPAQVTADTTIDAKGKVLTPGFIGSLNQLGLVEVGAVASSRDAGDKKAGISFDASLAFNPRTSLIPYARKGGITSDVVVPHGGDSIFAGLAFVADLSGNFDSVTKKQVALVVNLGSKHRGSRAQSLQSFIDKLDAHQQKQAAKSDKKDKKKASKKPSKETTVLNKVLSGEMPVVVRASRAADMLELLKVKERFGLNMVIAGAQDAPLIKDELAKANVPVIISAMDNLPGSFDSLHADLTTAGMLEKAGIKVILSVTGDSSHNVYQLRYDAGNAVSYGMSKTGALKAVSANVAEVFGLERGTIATGKKADLVLWSADPFEISTRIEKVWINGEPVSTESRHDKLRERYTTPSDMPRAYTK